ncbi:flagellar protein MotY [Legionella hackeliae]|uniref:Putative Sodium-type flagellar protein motY n=1 Tax=Legionella hackeliae TaxID=449 RepID=A0A0A8UX99_LEGHA|nr:OmpA family protein [Legionella hackeliae]KTD12697.1 sodium-type flagellar protein [Legionella hackeliae]CEK12116.1 putative Sodium-type flagellar protein motY precursor [Legionella hackeliae]STX48902.1 sodium-type flagellar protein [Legionella hackeliae]
MTFIRFVIQCQLRIAILCWLPFSAMATVHVDYASPMGDENWRMSGSKLRCGLSLTVPNYGIAYFEQYAAKPPHFILSKWQQVQKQLPAVVYAAPPIWKPQGKSYFISKTTVNPGEYGLYLPREPALKVLTYLAEGFQTKFEYQSEEGFPVTVALSPVHFQRVYAKYQRCLGNLLPFDYASVKTTIIYFDSDSFELSDEAKKLLKKVAIYSRVDQQVKKIKIAGYTDDTGRKSYNNAVSEARAKAVASYLQSQGVREDRLSVTWFGIKDPVAPNDSEAGKTLNRRTVVKIIKSNN